MIKILICDGDGTLGFDQGLAPGLVAGLAELGITLAVASNRPANAIVKQFQEAGIEPPKLIVTKADVPNTRGKPDPKFVDVIVERAKVTPQEVAFLGDDDNTDILCAINAGVLPLSAGYSLAETPRKYGIPIESVDYLIRYLWLYGTQSVPLFGWQYQNMCDDTSTTIDMRALIGQHSSIPRLTDLLKGDVDPDEYLIGPRNRRLTGILGNYLITRLFLNGDIERDKATIVTVYPGHLEGTQNQLLGYLADEFKTVFRSLSTPVLVRHSDAPESKLQGANRNIHDQFRTVMVDPDERKHVNNKHVIVLDDFTTCGYSLETARRMLLKAGARRVTCIAIGKWNVDYSISHIVKDWDPYEPCKLGKNDIKVNMRQGEFFSSADTAFRKIHEYLSSN